MNNFVTDRFRSVQCTLVKATMNDKWQYSAHSARFYDELEEEDFQEKLEGGEQRIVPKIMMKIGRRGEEIK